MADIIRIKKYIDDTGPQPLASNPLDGFAVASNVEKVRDLSKIRGVTSVTNTPTGDWNNQELAVIYRVEGLLIQAGFAITSGRGLTEDNHPWLVFCWTNEEMFVHLARLDGRYILYSSCLAKPLEGLSFEDLTREFCENLVASRHSTYRAKVIQLHSNTDHKNKFLSHSSVLLASLIWALFMQEFEARASGLEPADGNIGTSGLGQGHVLANDHQFDLESYKTETINIMKRSDANVSVMMKDSAIATRNNSEAYKSSLGATMTSGSVGFSITTGPTTSSATLNTNSFGLAVALHQADAPSLAVTDNNQMTIVEGMAGTSTIPMAGTSTIPMAVDGDRQEHHHRTTFFEGSETFAKPFIMPTTFEGFAYNQSAQTAAEINSVFSNALSIVYGVSSQLITYAEAQGPTTYNFNNQQAPKGARDLTLAQDAQARAQQMLTSASTTLVDVEPDTGLVAMTSTSGAGRVTPIVALDSSIEAIVQFTTIIIDHDGNDIYSLRDRMLINETQYVSDEDKYEGNVLGDKMVNHQLDQAHLDTNVDGATALRDDANETTHTTQQARSMTETVIASASLDQKFSVVGANIQEYTNDVALFLQNFVHKSTWVETVFFQKELVIIDKLAVDEATDRAYAASWVMDDGIVVSAVGHATTFAEYGLF